ncbi:MAG: BzdV protein, partial [bacterium]|nr:BzdV protein [bacterium]
FGEVEHGLAGGEARTEAGRCLQCDLRLLLAQAVLPPLPWLELNQDAVAGVPELEGVYQLLGEDRIPIRNVGPPNLRSALGDELDAETQPPYFVYDEDPMYTKRESELIQQFLAAHGRMPEGDDDLDDLF